MSASASHDVDIEAQIEMNNPDGESLSSNHSHVTSHEINEGGHYSAAEITRDKSRIDTSHSHHEAPPPTNAPPGQSGWKPLKADGPLFTKIPESKDMKETWVKAMGEADDGMCKGWKDQIDTLIIFAGLFSATVTAFTIESYQWLDETPANTLARLQLRDLLNPTHDPAMDHLAPAAFHVSSTSVAINTLWFASLTFSLAAVVISILCKQWLHEYQRLTGMEGASNYLVPPILLQTALVLFLVGVLILLWSLQTVVASFTTLIIGATFIFLIVTTILPSIQYVVPIFETQCAYKSSQSWSFFVISSFWLFDLNEFTNWGSIDQWEIYNIDDGMGRTLSWVFRLFRHGFDTFLNMYSIIADKSLKPTLNRDLAVLPDFFDELSTSSPYKLEDMRRLSKKINVYQHLGRIRHLRLSLHSALNEVGRHRSRFHLAAYFPDYVGSSNLIDFLPTTNYHLPTQSLLYLSSCLLGLEDHPMLFNRSIEHWARSLEFRDNVPTEGMIWIADTVYSTLVSYEPEIAQWLIGFHTHLFQEFQFPLDMADSFIAKCYPKLMKSHHQCKLDPSPVTLLKCMQEWINRVSESTPYPIKIDYIRFILDGFHFLDMTFETFISYHTSDLEKECLSSFIRFIVDYSEQEEFQQALDPDNYWHEDILAILESFRQYLDENTTAPPSDVNQNDLSIQSPGSTEAVIENT